jgi:hypothetical protein
VSAQYLRVCKEHKVKLDPVPKIGEMLSVTSDYFERAYACIFEIGTKLAHVLWRKLLPDQRHTADQNLDMLIYDLVVARKYDLAVILGNFAIATLKEWSSDSIRRAMVINLAQAHKWKGDKATAMKILDDEDWSACSDMFQLPVTVLRGQFERATGMMATMGASGKIQKCDYREWPVFKEFRESPVFLETYKKIYGHDLVPVETTPLDTFFGMLDGHVGPTARITVGIESKPAPSGGSAAGQNADN